ncbi:MAG: DNA-binding response regulator [Cytophagales bacterium CG18_big_fil_WC_8_21_14_2_50_42_9]|nr:MAG: DNA-binding response regulator [Cytophagales bacterium CG18_big_fil_WC_8_21_14_2_50_42_9]
MKVLIIEDEKLAADRLASLIKQYDANIEIIGKIGSVRKAAETINIIYQPDLIFMDIQLGDGLSFEIFEKTEIKCPVIFTTAYDEYAIRAFKVNSIDYLLKPIDADELAVAIDKFKVLRKTEKAAPNLALLEQAMQLLGKQQQYKNRFVIKIGEHIKYVPTENIDFFFSMEKATFLQTKENKRFVIDYPLDQLENMVNPKDFFRINRAYLVGLTSIQDIISYSNSRLKTVLRNSPEPDIVVSRDKVTAFKDWLEG